MKFQRSSSLAVWQVIGLVAGVPSPVSAFPVSTTRTAQQHRGASATELIRNAAVSSDSTETGTSSSSLDNTKKSSRVAILLCPAQFCVPDDYEVLFDNLKANYDYATTPLLNCNSLQTETTTNYNNITIGTCLVAPLPRTEWIKVARQLPTKNFWDATLPVHKTLGWYFDAMETALADIFAKEGPDVNICIVGHSIGGWVARAYLGGLSRSSTAVAQLAREQCSSLITLGTPHISPESALVDQTRGLLREIAETPACSSQSLADQGIDITCVCSSSLSGDFWTTDVEQLVAASSYLPLLGRFGGEVRGDGIVPLELAFMEPPARPVQIDQCEQTGAPVRHSHVLPTPWNLWDGYAPSIRLPDDFASYVSDGVIPQWAKYIR